MTNDRTDTARDHDDSDLIDNMEKTPSEQGRAGGNLARYVATDASMKRVRDPEAHEGVDKQDEIDHGERLP